MPRRNRFKRRLSHPVEMTLTGCPKTGSKQAEITVHRAKRDVHHAFYVLANGETAATALVHPFRIDREIRKSPGTRFRRRTSPRYEEYGDGPEVDHYPEKNYTEEKEREMKEKLVACPDFGGLCGFSCAPTYHQGTCLNRKKQPVTMFCKVRKNITMLGEVNLKYVSSLVTEQADEYLARK